MPDAVVSLVMQDVIEFFPATPDVDRFVATVRDDERDLVDDLRVQRILVEERRA